MFYKLVLVTCLGAVLEFFDFAIVILFANELSEIFLPEAGDVGRLWIFAIYLLGNLSRVFGGVLFSHFGDKEGRIKLFRLSIITMSISTLGIGLLPTYASIGIASTILLAVLRMFQGFSVGGELPGAVVFAAEHVNPNCRGVLTSAIVASAIIGLVMASAMGVFLHYYLSHEQLIIWGWRIPFVVGSMLGLLGYFLRKGFVETPLFSKVFHRELISNIPVVDLFRYNRAQVLVGLGITSSAAAMVTLYMQLPPYASHYLGFPSDSVFVFTTFALFVLSMLTIFCGWLSDAFGRKNMLVVGGSLLLLVAYFSNNAIYAGALWVAMVLTIIPAAIANGCYIASLCELFPTSIRYTGVAVCLNVGVGVFGGSVPYILELLNQLGYNFGPLMLMLFTGFFTIVSSLCMVSQQRSELGNSKMRLV